jgi:hypothetical protein
VKRRELWKNTGLIMEYTRDEKMDVSADLWSLFLPLSHRTKQKN